MFLIKKRVWCLKNSNVGIVTGVRDVISDSSTTIGYVRIRLRINRFRVKIGVGNW